MMQQNPYFSPLYPEAQAKRSYTYIGFGMLVFVGVATGLQLMLSFAVPLLFPWIEESEWYIWALSLIPMYLVAFPISLLLFFQIPAYKLEKRKLSLAAFLGILTVAFFLLYVGNYMGMIVNSFLSGITGHRAGDVLEKALGASDPWVTALATVVVAPVMEKWITRKLIIDRTCRFGKMTACIFSACVFGLLHGNFQQFFYAFLAGLLFALVYVKTGNVLYTILLHATINFMGGVIPILLTEKINRLDALLSGGENLLQALSSLNIAGFLPLFIYLTSMLSMAVIGLVMVIAFNGQLFPERAAGDIPKERVFSTVYLTPGVVCYMLLSAAMFILSQFA